MSKTGLIGHPVAQSKSPLIHGYWLKKYGLEGTYEAHDITPENLESGIRKLIGAGYKGFNITVPHKEAVFKLCDELDDTAKAVGAVNTVIIENGRMKGMNTDVFGFLENIRQEAPGFEFKNAVVEVIGAGGAARAAVFGLLEAGAGKIVICNRTREKAEIIGQMSPKIQVLDWNHRENGLKNADLLVNTSILGMEGQKTLDLNLKTLKKSAYVYDIVYKPLETPLLKDAKALGYEVITGIGMLLHQARLAFKAWHGVMPEVDEALKAKVLG